MAEAKNPYVHLETMEEAKNPNGEFNQAWGAKRKSVDSSDNSKSILEKFCNANSTRGSLKESARPSRILQYPDTVRASALMRLNRRIPNGTYGGVGGRLLN